MATVTGNLGVNNTLTGTSARDRIYGDTRSTLATIGGNDTINALDGDDYIYGDAYRDITGAGAKGGNDSINGDAGNDIIYGDGNYRLLNGAVGGNDTIDGGIDDDIITGDVRIAITGAGSLGGNDDIIGGSGNDRIYGDSRDDITNGGQGGVDTVYGGDDNDRIYGDAGDDLINATGGGDFLYGQDGDDIIAGDAADDMTTGSVGGDDTLDGGIGNDTLFGDAGGNLLDSSQGGADTITGGTGDDIIFGDAGEDLNNSAVGGNDILDGGDNNDLISGDAGNELKNGSIGGDDNLQGGDGDDKLYGDAVDSFLIQAVGGIDTIDGGLGADIISGDAGGSFYDNSQGGDDILMAGNDTTGGPNIIYGDAGNTIYLSSHGGNDTITGSEVTDIVYGDAGVDIYGNSSGGVDTINTLGGDDEISGDAGRSLFDFAVGGDDIIDAGAGNDTVYGDAKLLMRLSAQGGDDTIHGGDNDDIISGDAGHKLYENAVGGDDILYGDDGDDLIVGDTLEYITSGGVGGNDTISGGAGNDIIHGDALRFISSTGFGGNDRLQGDAGNDLVYGDAGDDIAFYDWDVNNSISSYSDFYSGGAGSDTLTILFTTASDVANIQLALQDYAAFIAGTPAENDVFDFNPYGFDLRASGFEAVISNALAQDDDYLVAKDAVVTAESLFVNDINPGAIIEVDGLSANVGTVLTLASGATLTVNANGTYDFDTNHAYDALTRGQTETVTFTYTVDNGQLDIVGDPITSTATVTLSITEINSRPNALDDDNFNVLENPSATTYADIILADAPVLYYRFEETSGSLVQDYSASGLFDGAYHAHAGAEPAIVYGVNSVSSQLGSAATFQGFKNSAVDIPTLTGISFANGFSIEAWVQVELGAGSIQNVFGNANGGIAGSVFLQKFNANYMYSINGPTENINYSGPSGSWDHVVLSMDPDGTMHMYKNGAEQTFINGVVGATNNPAGPRSFTASLSQSVIGGDPFNAARFFTGNVDEFAIYNYALDGTDISAHYDAATASAIESINVLLNDDDPEMDALTVISVTDPVVGTPVAVVSGTPTVVQLNSGAIISMESDGTVSYDPNDAFESLAEGSTGSDTFTYTVSDGYGGTDTGVVTVTITGFNDAPTATNNSNEIDEDVSTPVTGNLLTDDDGFGVDDDVDIGDSFTVTMVDSEMNPLNSVVGSYGTLTWDSNGAYSYMLDNGNPAVQALAVGETIIDTFTYQITDNHGLTDQADLNITINGTNDPVTAVSDSFDVQENTALDYASLLLYSDPVLYYRFEETSGSVVEDYSLAGAFDGTYRAHAGGEPAIVYSASSVDPALGSAATFQGFKNSAVDIPTLTGVDFSNGFSIETWVQVNLGGASIQNVFGHPGGAVGGSVFLQKFGGQYLYSINGPTENIYYPGATANWEHIVLSVDDTGTMHMYKDGIEQTFNSGIFGATNNPAGPRSFTADLSQSVIGGDPFNFARFFTGYVDEFAIYDYALDQATIQLHHNNVLTGAIYNVLFNDTDDDVSDSHTVTQVQGSALNVGVATTTNSGALVTVLANGNVTYDTNGQFEHLDQGDTAIDTFTYQVSDGYGGMDTETVSITVHGENDAPVVANQTFEIHENSFNSTSVGFVLATDVDDSAVLTYNITGGTGATAFEIDLNTGEVTVLDELQLDYEALTSFTLDIEVSDGSLTDTALITIDLLDVIEGNGSDNTITATALDDVMTGNGGSDVFVIGLGTGNDVITDFDALDDNEDIDLTAYATNLSAVLANATQEGADVVIDLAALGGSAGDNLTLENVLLTNLTDGNDFLL